MVRYVFNAADTGGRNHLWATDGTAGGTAKVSDVNTDYTYFFRSTIQVPTGFTSLGNGYAVFFATSDAVGTELWVTDGTAAGTALVKDIFPGTGPYSVNSSFPSNFAALGNGRALFSANGGSTGNELWTTDGTAAGTYRVKDIYPGVEGSSPYLLTSLGNGQVLFRATDGSTGGELWATDGTAAGTRLVRDIHPGGEASGPYSSYPMDITSLGNGRAVFSADDGSTGRELWASDGTAEGTSLVRDIEPAGDLALGPGSSPNGFVPLGDGRALFVATDTGTGSELWITDGTAAGTYQVKDINPGVNASGVVNSSAPGGFTPVGGGRFVFGADGGTGRELWITDGTAARTSLVRDINPGTVTGAGGRSYPASSYPSNLTALDNGKVLFSATDGRAENELWVTDGTAAGTTLVQDNYPGGAGPYLYGSGAGVTRALPGGKALISASNAAAGQELWVTDGTAAGTSLLRDLNPGSGSSTPNGVTALTLLRGASGPDPLFDAVYYATRNLDVAAAGVDPYQHYIRNGYREGRNPDALFDTQYYLSQNPDVAAAGVNPLLHWEQYGYREGRNPSAQFDSQQYFIVNRDVAAAGLDPLRHYLTDGRVEGRVAYAVPGAVPAPLVDASYYYAANPDVAASGLDATAHYVTWGWHDGRNPDTFFDTGYYLSRNPDVAQSGLNPLEHYDRYGWHEGRDPSAQFSTGKYLAAYSDVRAAGVDPLQHYLQYGRAEGRQAFPA